MLGFELRRSCARCSVMVFTIDLDALYAAFPGGFVIPCLLPVVIIDAGCFVFWTNGKNAARPLTGPKTFTANVLWK
jgi:hypothetical protein